jgi:hypothetical protein
MTQTPAPRFVTRPTPPAINTPEYDRWTKESALSYPGGTLTSAYGNLVQTISIDSIGFQCSPPEKAVSVPASNPVLTIGQPAISRKSYSYNRKQYAKKNSSLAAAGHQVRVVTAVGEYTARLTGSISALATYLCDNNNALYDAVYVYSPRGAEYGPFTPGAA